LAQDQLDKNKIFAYRACRFCKIRSAIHELWRCLIIIIVVFWSATYTFLHARKSTIIYRHNNSIVCFRLLNTKCQPRDRRTTQSLNTIPSQCPSLIARLNYILCFTPSRWRNRLALVKHDNYIIGIYNNNSQSKIALRNNKRGQHGYIYIIHSNWFTPRKPSPSTTLLNGSRSFSPHAAAVL